MSDKVAIFADGGSSQAREIAEAVAEQGGAPLLCDIQAGGKAGNTLAIGPGRLSWNGEDFAQVRAVHIRCTALRTLPALPALLNAASHAEYRAQFLREQEYQAATYAFFEHLVGSGRLVVNPLTSAYVDHNSKSQFYEKLRDWGFRAPRSLTTNDPAAAAAFLDMVGEAVAKPAIGVGSTRLVQPEDRERLDELAEAPALLQERVTGDVARVHVVGGRMVLALRVLSETIDSRTAPQGFEYLELAEEECDLIVRATHALGLRYAGWDAILSEEGRLTYLDCNPGPNLMWITRDFRKVVFDRLATYLLGFVRGGSLEEAAALVTPWRPA